MAHPTFDSRTWKGQSLLPLSVQHSELSMDPQQSPQIGLSAPTVDPVFFLTTCLWVVADAPFNVCLSVNIELLWCEGMVRTKGDNSTTRSIHYLGISRPSLKSVTFADAVPHQPVSVGAPESHFHISKTPSMRAASFSLLVTDYGATYFRDALARYIVTCRNPALSSPKVERQSAKVYFHFSSVRVFHKIKLTIKDLSSSVDSSFIDVAHVKPASKDKRSKTAPGRFNTVLVCNVESSTFIGAHSKFQIFSSSGSK